MIAEKNTCASVRALTQAAETRKGCSTPTHNSVHYFIIATIKSQTFHIVGPILDKRPRNTLLSKYRAEIIQLAIRRAKWLKARSKGQG